MNFAIIPNEQTPRVDDITIDIKDYIKKNKSDFLNFLSFASLQTSAVGLAANQCLVGSLDGERFMERVFAIKDIQTKEWRLVIDPKIIKYIGIKEEKGEGCLTWAQKIVVAERYRAVRVDYYDLDGNKHSNELYSGFEGQIWQHEINHLDGVEEILRIFYKEPIYKYRRNERCTCGSGKKYKNCCGRFV